MKNIKKLITTILVGTLIVGITGCDLVEKTPEAIKNSTVAKVNDEKITRGQLDLYSSQLMAQVKQQYGDNWAQQDEVKQNVLTQKKQILDQLVVRTLVIQKAKEAKWKPDDAKIDKDVESKFNESKKGFNDDKKFEEQLKSLGFTDATYKSLLKDDATYSQAEDVVLKDVKVSEADIEKEYNTNKALKYTEKPSTITLSHLLVKTEDEAKKAKARVDAGEAFDKVAKEVSTDTASKEKGGDLGTYYLDQTKNQDEGKALDPTFFTAAIALKVNQVSPPVQTSYGWHVIKCTARQDYPAKKLEDVKATIKSSLLTTAKNTELESKVTKWKSQLGSKIKTYEKNIM